MTGDGSGVRIRGNIQRKIEKVSRRLAELQDSEDLQTALAAAHEELRAVEAELDKVLRGGDEVAPGVRERLEARRERLLARQDRIELKIELRDEMRERLEGSLEDLRLQLQTSVDQARSMSQVGARSSDRYSYFASRSMADTADNRSMEEERRKILEMVRDGTISADEAAQLLDALQRSAGSARRSRRRPRWVRIRVTDNTGDNVRVNLTLPVGLVRAGLRAGGSIAGLEGLDTAGLEEMLDRGEAGHILDVQDRDGNERIEIFVE